MPEILENTLSEYIPDACLINEDDLTNSDNVFDESTKRRLYTFVVWPESIDVALFFHLLHELHIPVAISPLHNRDLTDENELKKPHYHVIVEFRHPRYLDPVRATIGKLIQSCSKEPIIGGDGGDYKWYVLPVHDRNVMVRYLCHLDDEDKASYPVNEVITFGFFDVSPLFARSLADDMHSFAKLMYWCREHPNKTYDQLVDVVIDSQDMTLLRALRQNSWALKSYLESSGKRRQIESEVRNKLLRNGGHE